MRKILTHLLTITLLILFGVRVTTYAARNFNPHQGDSIAHKHLARAKTNSEKHSVDLPVHHPRVRDESNHLSTSICPFMIQISLPTFFSLLKTLFHLDIPLLAFSIPTPPPSLIS